MNSSLKEKGLKKIKNKFDYYLRILDKGSANKAFGYNDSNKISLIYVINLDRKPDRWNNVKKELKRIKINYNKTLYDISRRFSAIDARYYEYSSNNNLLKNYYYLSDQLKVEPNDDYSIVSEEDDIKICMTKQEVAVTLSHIEVWNKFRDSDAEYVLILEDDVYFTRNFSSKIEKIWQVISDVDFDMLFLSFEYVKGINKKNIKNKDLFHKPRFGIWQASGYVLSKKGLKKLLDELPVYGPVDLWFNLKFPVLNVYMLNYPIIKQRNDLISSNSYSIMPVLTKLGLYSESKPLIMKTKNKLPFLFAFGKTNTGLSSLAEALSMIGYTCCSNLVENPNEKIFNAYVNVGNNNIDLIKKLKFKNAKIICTSEEYLELLKKENIDFLYLPDDTKDKWDLLSRFLNIEYPSFEYPKLKDIKQQAFNVVNSDNWKYEKLKWDKLPWINPMDNFLGLKIIDNKKYELLEWLSLGNKNNWKFDAIECRKDTFPSNLAIFKKENVEIINNILTLSLYHENAKVRNYTSGAIVSTEYLSYGKYSVEIKPSGVEGIITGVFLHRNSPHQEIDIEFLGKNHYGMLINVFYNPGIDGTKLEYGYRGTPIWVNLDFDVTEDFHEYEIEWNEHYIIWKVDELEVYKRNVWQPTPIPSLPMQFNINIWNTNSVELAGILENNKLPTMSEIKSVKISKYKKVVGE